MWANDRLSSISTHYYFRQCGIIVSLSDLFWKQFKFTRSCYIKTLETRTLRLRYKIKCGITKFETNAFTNVFHWNFSKLIIYSLIVITSSFNAICDVFQKCHYRMQCNRKPIPMCSVLAKILFELLIHLSHFEIHSKNVLYQYLFQPQNLIWDSKQAQVI